jgi:hypothetical protein
MLERRKRELELIHSRYGELDVGPNLEWVVIKRFPVPSGWNRDVTSILVLIHPAYPTTPPDNFLVDNDLRLSNGQLPGNVSPDQSHLGRTWLQFSYHIDAADWKPHPDLLNGHNLLTFLLGVERRLAEAN